MTELELNTPKSDVTTSGHDTQIRPLNVEASLVAAQLNAKEKTAQITAPDLKSTLDFRKYLADFFEFKKFQTRNQLRPYNYAVFSAAADIKSPNYLKMIIDGKRNLSDDMIGKFAKALGLQKDDAEEFRLLVVFGQAQTPSQRAIFLKQLSEHRVHQKIRTGEISEKHFQKVPSWVAWVIYSMLDQDGVSFSPEKLKATLRDQVSLEEIKNALETLLTNGEIYKSESGELKRKQTLTDDADEIPVALVRKLQAELMYLGLESLYKDAPTEREFGTATLALTQSEFEEIRFQLRKLRKQVQKDIGVKRMTSKGERVFQLNLQLFPVTQKS